MGQLFVQVTHDLDILRHVDPSQDLSDETVGIHLLPHRRLPAGEVEQAGDDPIGRLHLLLQDLNRLPHRRLGFLQRHIQEVRRVPDRSQGIPQFVPHSSGQLAQDGHTLPTNQLLLYLSQRRGPLLHHLLQALRILLQGSF